MDSPSQLPLLAAWTGPGALRLFDQHGGVFLWIVVSIGFGLRKLATRRGIPPNTADIICHGGTYRLPDFEMRRIPEDNFSSVNVSLGFVFPSAATASVTSLGPPLFTI